MSKKGWVKGARTDLIPTERIEKAILLIRGEKVLLSQQLAERYEVETKVLNQAAARNRERFPEDFMFQLSTEEMANLKSQFVTSSWGGIRTPPYVFTEQGVGNMRSDLATFSLWRSRRAKLFELLERLCYDIRVRTAALIPTERIEKAILLIRGEKVMLDSDLAELYGVETKVLNQAVRRNLDRFPADFSFRLTAEETEELNSLRSQFVTLKRGEHRKYLPLVFTEQGVAMLSSVLHSPRAVAVNIEIMRAFVRLRQMLASHAGLARKLEALEKRYDRQFKVVFDAIRRLMSPIEPKRREIGFHAKREPGSKAVT